MSIQSVLLPVLVQVALVFVLIAVMIRTRAIALNAGLRKEDIALSNTAWPSRARQASNCYGNQFEMPVLFLFAVLFAIVLRQAGWLFVLLEWLFVACRLGHAVVHTTSNNLYLRGPLFFGSAVATALLWLLIFFGVFFAPSIA